MMTADGGAKERKPVFYGWYIVATCIFVAFVTNGARNSFGIFVLPMSEEFEWSRGTISFAAALGFMVNGITQPFMGQLLDRFGGRRVITVSIAVFGVATVALSLTFHYLFLIFMFGVVSSIALSGMSLNNTGTLLSRWFRRRRATVVGLNASGLSAGGLILVPLGMYLLQSTNWRITWVAFGLAVLALSVPLAFFFLKDDPKDMGLSPDGDAEPADTPGNPVSRRIAGILDTDQWKESYRSMPIWQMTIAYFACGYTTAVLSVHFVPFADSLGIGPQTAAFIFALMMGLNVVGSIGAGVLSDKFSRKNMLGIVYFVRGTAYMLMLASVVFFDLGTVALLLFAVVAGVSWIATAPLTTALIADVYGVRALGTISGVAFLVHAVGSGISIWLAGELFDLTGSYTLPFFIAGLMLFPASVFAFSIKEKKYSSRYQPVEPAVMPAAGD
ncbi:MAG: MFS transporter [Chloroflexota bacterium]|nr:MFS transporter [Chloroflexota bacterium]